MPATITPLSEGRYRIDFAGGPWITLTLGQLNALLAELIDRGMIASGNTRIRPARR